MHLFVSLFSEGSNHDLVHKNCDTYDVECKVTNTAIHNFSSMVRDLSLFILLEKNTILLQDLICKFPILKITVAIISL